MKNKKQMTDAEFIDEMYKQMVAACGIPPRYLQPWEPSTLEEQEAARKFLEHQSLGGTTMQRLTVNDDVFNSMVETPKEVYTINVPAHLGAKFDNNEVISIECGDRHKQVKIYLIVIMGDRTFLHVEL